MRVNIPPIRIVLGEHLGRFVAGLAHDVALADSVHGGLGDASGAQGVTAQGLRLQTGAAGGHFENPADAVLVERAGILKIEREKTGGNRSGKAAGWLCTPLS